MYIYIYPTLGVPENFENRWIGYFLLSGETEIHDKIRLVYRVTVYRLEIGLFQLDPWIEWPMADDKM
jgi:hypothetical protein